MTAVHTHEAETQVQVESPETAPMATPEVQAEDTALPNKTEHEEQ